jgi:hypothetical protein
MNVLQFFEKMNIARLEEFITTTQEENLHLDFKVVNRPDFTHGDDKKNFAKALSGFANSSGGLIIWGVNARKNAQGIDCATEIREIVPVQLFLARLNEFTGMGVSPIVEGVRHKVIETSSEGGVVVSMIPESDAGPHMANLGEDRYYKRSGDSFYRMEHFDLEDMFGRRKRPKLKLIPTIIGRGTNTLVILSLRNDGRATAKAPYLAFDVNRPYIFNQYGIDGNMNHGMKRLKHTGADLQYRFGEDSTFVIHPGISLDVTSIHLGLVAENPPDRDLEISYLLAAEDIRLESGRLVVPLSNLS